jgi:hypothetical protein
MAIGTVTTNSVGGFNQKAGFGLFTKPVIGLNWQLPENPGEPSPVETPGSGSGGFISSGQSERQVSSFEYPPLVIEKRPRVIEPPRPPAFHKWGGPSYIKVVHSTTGTGVTTGSTEPEDEIFNPPKTEKVDTDPWGEWGRGWNVGVSLDPSNPADDNPAEEGEGDVPRGAVAAVYDEVARSESEVVLTSDDGKCTFTYKQIETVAFRAPPESGMPAGSLIFLQFRNP